MRDRWGMVAGTVLVALVCALAVSACGSGDPGDEPDPDASPTPTPIPTITPAPTASPTPVPPSTSVRSLSIDGRHVCWLDDTSRPRCRMISNTGQVTQVPAPDIVSSRVATGGAVSCGLDVSGLIWCDGPADPWGVSTDYPAGVFDDIGVGGSIACALSGGSATCWGRTEILSEGLPARGITQMTVGGSSVCVLDGSGQAFCAGQVASPEPLPPEGAFELLDANGDLNCGIRRSDGGIDCWAARFPARDKEPSGATFVDIAASNAGSCALRTDGSLSCAGTTEPPSFDLSNAGPYTEIEGGADLICGVIGTAAIECWTTGGTTTLLRVAVE